MTMTRGTRTVLSLALAIAAVFVVTARGAIAARAAAAAQAIAPASGAAPLVEWRGQDGAVVRLASLKGKVVLVDFWASWCPPCRESFPALDLIQRDYRDRGVDVIAVNVDERQKDADAFLAAHPHHLLVVFDPRGVSPKAFKVRGMPTSFVIDRQGAIRYTHQGYPQGTDKSYRRELDALLAEPVR